MSSPLYFMVSLFHCAKNQPMGNDRQAGIESLLPDYQEALVQTEREVTAIGSAFFTAPSTREMVRFCWGATHILATRKGAYYCGRS